VSRERSSRSGPTGKGNDDGEEPVVALANEHTKRDRSIFGEFLAALTGAAIISILQLLFLLRPGTAFDWSDWRSLALAAITGAILGWGYRLANGLRKTLDEALTRLEGATRALDYQQEPLRMILSAKRHKETITQLVSDSLKEKYRFISYVHEPQYLKYLISAISMSDKSTGVKRRPVRSYKESDGGMMTQYLHALRDRKMKQKVRIFIIDPQDEEHMKEDLANVELMDFYWDNAGREVTSYWITATDFTNRFAGQLTIPKEFAIYDDELLIEYDEPSRTLFFDIVQPSDKRLEVFRQLAEQEESNLTRPFTKIEPPQI
jgi:hypothetical protein